MLQCNDIHTRAQIYATMSDLSPKIFVSSDEGATWTKYDTPVALHKLIPNPLDPTLVLALSYLADGATTSTDVQRR